MAQPSLSTQISCLRCSFTYTVTLLKYNSIFTSLAISASFSMIIIQPLINSTNMCLPCSFCVTNCKCSKFLFGFCSEINFILSRMVLFFLYAWSWKAGLSLSKLTSVFYRQQIVEFCFLNE